MISLKRSSSRVEGEYSVSLDDKNRLYIPTAIRSVFSDGVIYMMRREKKNPEEDKFYPYLALYTVQDVDFLRSTLGAYAQTAVHLFNRVPIDNASRVNVTPDYKNYAGISRKATIVARILPNAIDEPRYRMELWNAEVLEDYRHTVDFGDE